MPELTSIGGASLYLFLKTHAPALFGAIFSSERVPKDNLSVITWIMTWVVVNAFGLFIVIVLSVYLGDFVVEYRDLTDTQADVMRLIVGLFGLKLIRYFNGKIEPVLNEMVEALLDKFKSLIGVGCPTQPEDRQSTNEQKNEVNHD